MHYRSPHQARNESGHTDLCICLVPSSTLQHELPYSCVPLRIEWQASNLCQYSVCGWASLVPSGEVQMNPQSTTTYCWIHVTVAVQAKKGVAFGTRARNLWRLPYNGWKWQLLWKGKLYYTAKSEVLLLLAWSVRWYLLHISFSPLFCNVTIATWMCIIIVKCTLLTSCCMRLYWWIKTLFATAQCTA